MSCFLIAPLSHDRQTVPLSQNTPEHPFWVEGAGWVEAKELNPGDELLTSDGETVVVEKVEHIVLEEPVAVYNFEVEGVHNYYVGSLQVLVHNTCGNSSAEVSLAGRGSTGRVEPITLFEQMAMKEVMSEPLRGAILLNSVILNDSRWPEADGWVKMARHFKSIAGERVEIHFNYNTRTGEFDDFKFK